MSGRAKGGSERTSAVDVAKALHTNDQWIGRETFEPPPTIVLGINNKE